MIYLFHGDNYYESSQELQKMLSELSSKNPLTTIKTVHGDEIQSINDLFSSSDAFGLFSATEILVVKRFFSNKASLLALAADYLEGRKDVDMIFWEDKKSDKRSKLYKLIKKTGTVREFENKKGAVLRSWLTKKVEDSGYKITPRIAEDIIFRAGENQAMLDNELDKIFTYLDFKKSKEVTDEMLQLISESAEANIWNFIDRMVAGDHKKVLTELETLVKDKQHYIMTLGMITRQLRIMAQVKELMTTDEKGLNSLGMHPFVLEKTKRAVSKFTMEKIGQLYKRLVGLDLSIKEGKIEEKLGLSLYVLSF